MMLTKQLRFDDDVLAVLRGMEWQQGGLLGILTCGQLERALYVRVNKALGAMGGNWNQRAAGHIFRLDPRPQVEGLLDNGVLIIEKDGFFETPPAIVERTLELIVVRGTILEPSAGLGAIADKLPRDSLVCVEKNAERAIALQQKGYRTEHRDFLTMSGQFDTIVMNPPFEQGQDIDHVRHAYEVLAPGGWMVSVMSEGPFFRQDKKAQAFRAWLVIVGGYSEKLDNGAFKDSGTQVCTRLVTIHRAIDTQPQPRLEGL